jgi:hypothetical protein
MSEAFVPFERYVRPMSEAAAPADTEPARKEPEELLGALRDVRLFRAALADAFDATRALLLRELAVSVLARELTLAPADMERIATRTLEQVYGDEPMCVRANANEVAALASLSLPVREDGALRAGDVVIELRYGTIDASMGVRLAQVLEAFA